MSLRRGLQYLARAPAQRKAVTEASLITAGYPLSGADATDTFARKLSTVDRCMSILAGSMAKLPNFIMNTHTRDRIQHPLLHVLNIRPNEAMTPSIRKEVLENSRNEGGNGYDWIIRSPRTGQVEELIPIPWYLVEPWRDTSGRIWYTVTHPVTGEPMKLPQEDVCHYKGATRDGLKGMSTLRRASETLAAARAAQQYELAYYESGGQPSGVLRTAADLGGPAIGPDGNPIKRSDGSLLSKKDHLRNEWEKVHAGPRNSHRVAILDHDLDYKPIAASNQEAQFVENKEVSIRDIARYFGIPLYKLGEGKESYSSNEQNAIEYVVGTLHPIITQYEEEQTWKLLTNREIAEGLEVRINLMAELRGDAEARGRWYQIMLQEGPFSVNDVLALEDLPNVPGGDRRRASLNYVPLDLWPELSMMRAQSGLSGE